MWFVRKIKIVKTLKKSNGGESGQNQVTKATKETEGELDVLPLMFVTAAVFHLEMSALNAETKLNAVGGCRCVAIQKK